MKKEEQPKTHVAIKTDRQWFGNDSTISTFIATAYDEQGNAVDTLDGYFLEPKTDYKRAKICGDDKAIMHGTYNIVPKQAWQRFEWYVDKVPGRSGIAIHGGNKGSDTSGCLIPATSFKHDKATNNYSVTGSSKKKNELFDFFKKYGGKGITITIGI